MYVNVSYTEFKVYNSCYPSKQNAFLISTYYVPNTNLNGSFYDKVNYYAK